MVVMSATTFAGSAQFAAVAVLEDGGTVLAAVVSAVLLNLRYVGQSIAAAVDLPREQAAKVLRVPADRGRVVGPLREVGTIRVADSRRRGSPPLRALGLEHGDRIRRRQRPRRSQRSRARRRVRRALPRARQAVPAGAKGRRRPRSSLPPSRSFCFPSRPPAFLSSSPRRHACSVCGDERRLDRRARGRSVHDGVQGGGAGVSREASAPGEGSVGRRSRGSR